MPRIKRVKKDKFYYRNYRKRLCLALNVDLSNESSANYQGCSSAHGSKGSDGELVNALNNDGVENNSRASAFSSPCLNSSDDD